jgi:hypothetical protein
MPAVKALTRTVALPVPIVRPVPTALPVLEQAEQDHRREMLRRAERENVIEGASCNPDTQYVREAFIRGDVDHDGAIAMLDLHYGVKRTTL